MCKGKGTSFRSMRTTGSFQSHFTPKLEGHSVERMYLRQSCFDGWLNKTILKTRLAAASSRASTYTWNFSDLKFRVSLAYTIAEKTVWFRHLDYNPDRAQKLSVDTQHFIQIQARVFWVILLTDRQTDRQTNASKRICLLLCRRLGGNNFYTLSGYFVLAYTYITVKFQLHSFINLRLTESSLYNWFALKDVPKWGFWVWFRE